MESVTVRIEDIDLEDTEFMSRLDFDDKTIRSLAEDIETFGLRNPVGLRPKGEKYQLIYGWERTKAVILLGRTMIEARVYTGLTDLEAQLHNISDNIEHEDLSTLEIALQAKALREDYGMTVKAISKIYDGKTQYVYDLLTLTNMDEPLKEAVHRGTIRLTHAIEIAKFPDSNRLETLKIAVDEGLSVARIKRLRSGIVKIKNEAIRTIVDRIVEISQNAGVESLEVTTDDLTALVYESELNRVKKFLMTQIADESEFKPGWTREKVAENYLNSFRHLIDEGVSLTELSRRINNLMFNIIVDRSRGAPNREDYDLSIKHRRDEFENRRRAWERLWQSGIRTDKPSMDMMCWSVREDCNHEAIHCRHEWSEDEDEETHCYECGSIQSTIQTADRSWRDPPDEEAPCVQVCTT